MKKLLNLPLFYRNTCILRAMHQYVVISPRSLICSAVFKFSILSIESAVFIICVMVPPNDCFCVSSVFSSVCTELKCEKYVFQTACPLIKLQSSQIKHLFFGCMELTLADSSTARGVLSRKEPCGNILHFLDSN